MTPDQQEDEFEQKIEALLKVDPTGLSGKHRGRSVDRCPHRDCDALVLLSADSGVTKCEKGHLVNPADPDQILPKHWE